MEIAQFEIRPVDGKRGVMLGHTGVIETDHVVSGTTNRDVIRRQIKRVPAKRVGNDVEPRH
jgi:hypothetical protein